MKAAAFEAYLILLVLINISLLACKKSNSPAKPSPLTVVNISPLHGPEATTVTISGTGFSSSTILDSIYFNGKMAAVTSATATQLIVSVPPLAGTGNVTVKIGGVVANGPSFTYDYQYVVSVYAGSGIKGAVDNTGTAASFFNPFGIAVDSSGNVYIADYGNNKIRKIAVGGVVTTFAGSGVAGEKDGTGIAANFNGPVGIVLDHTGNLYVTDLAGNTIRMISASGHVTTLAGTGALGQTNGTLSTATFHSPVGIAVDGPGNIYVAEEKNDIRFISGGAVTTYAGSAVSGAMNGSSATASFYIPVGLSEDMTNGDLYVADDANDLIRKITATGIVSTLAGTSAVVGSTDGIGTAAQFFGPTGVVLDGKGNLYVADQLNNTIRLIDLATAKVVTVAGSVTPGATNGIGTSASFSSPTGLAIDRAGNLYVSDFGNHAIRKVTLK